MRFLFVGGGSIGHIAPAVAVWRAIAEKDPSAEVHFVCSERPEDAAFLEKEHLPFTQIHGWKFSVLRPDIAWSSYRKAAALIRKWKPDAVFSKGGALSVAVCLAAKQAGIPIVLHESDAVSGRANTIVERWARIVCKGFLGGADNGQRTMDSTKREATRWPLPTDRFVFTGNPIRPAITQGNRDAGFALTGLSPNRPVLLVYGGSQGAMALNDAVRRHLPELLTITQVAHLTGKGKAGAGAQPGYWSAEVAYDDLPHLYAISDLALSRSGAGSISELAACGIPALLVPLRGLAQDHQLHNAVAAARSGGCVLLHQETVDDTLVSAVRTLTEDTKRRDSMAMSMRTLSAPHAARTIAEAIMGATQRKEA